MSCQHLNPACGLPTDWSGVVIELTSGTLAATFINRALIEENLVELDTLGECNNSNNLHTTLVIQSTT